MIHNYTKKSVKITLKHFTFEWTLVGSRWSKLIDCFTIIDKKKLIFGSIKENRILQIIILIIFVVIMELLLV